MNSNSIIQLRNKIVKNLLKVPYDIKILIMIVLKNNINVCLTKTSFNEQSLRAKVITL